MKDRINTRYEPYPNSNVGQVIATTTVPARRKSHRWEPALSSDANHAAAAAGLAAVLGRDVDRQISSNDSGTRRVFALRTEGQDA